MEIIIGETKEHNEALEKALNYILDTIEKQNNRLLPLDVLYGDGSRWLPLTKRGFELVYSGFITMDGIEVIK